MLGVRLYGHYIKYSVLDSTQFSTMSNLSIFLVPIIIITDNSSTNLDKTKMLINYTFFAIKQPKTYI